MVVITKIMVEEGGEVVTAVVERDHMEVMEQEVRSMCHIVCFFLIRFYYLSLCVPVTCDVISLSSLVLSIYLVELTTNNSGMMLLLVSCLYHCA